MKLFMFAVFMFAGVCHAQQIRPITQVNDINMVGSEYNSKPVMWFAGDSIRFDVYARDVRKPINLSGIVFPVLFVAAETNQAQVYIAATGTVISATNGHVSVSVIADDALLDPDIRYAAWMTVFRVSGGLTNEVATVAYSAATVKPSPAGTDYTFLPPMTSAFNFVFGDFGDPATWSEYPATDPVDFGGQTISNIGGIDGIVTFADMPVLPGYATGTPLYAYTETDPVWLAEKSAYATGTPLYTFTELDPIWTAASGAVWEAINSGVGTETDPIWSAASNDYATVASLSAYATGSPLYEVSFAGLATGTPLYVEAGTGTLVAASIASFMPGAAISNTFYPAANPSNFISSTAGAALFVAKAGDTMTGTLIVTNILSSAPTSETVPNLVLRGGNSTAAPKMSGGIVLQPGTNTAASNFGSVTILRSSGIVGDYVAQFQGSGAAINFNSLLSIRNSNDIEVLGGKIYIRDVGGSAEYAVISPTNIRFGANSFEVSGGGDIRQDATNTAFLGLLSAQSLTLDGDTITDFSRFSTGAPLYEIDLTPYATGTPVYSISGLATGSPLYEVDLSPYATGTPVYSISGLATGTPLYEVDLSPYATGTPVYSIAGLATGVPLYEIDLTPYATGTPIYSVSGLATGTPIYDISGLATGTPLYEVDLTPYATGTPIYSVSGLATGAPLYEIDLSPYATGTPIYSVSGLATGVPLYEIDLSPYATGTPIYSVSGLATGTPLYEVDFSPYATGTPLYVEVGTGTLVEASIADFMDGASLSNTFFHAGKMGSGSGLDADLLDGLQGAAYHTIASFQAYTTNATKFFVGNVTQNQAGTYGSIVANRTNGTTWISLGSTNWIKFTGAINEF